jgi:glycosyltransferase involved in cell wall biosynthesis
MRIIHFLNHTRHFNGHVNVAIDLACVQSKKGHTVAVVSGGGAFDALLADYGVEHIVIDQSRSPYKLLKAAYKLRSTISSFSPDIIHTHMMTSTGLAFLLRRFMKFKLVTTVHNDFEKSAVIMGLGDRVIAVSQAVADSMERRGVSKSKLRVVLNGTIGSPRLSAETPQAKAFNHPAIIFVGGLHPRKGVADLITAFKTVAESLPNASLNLVGSGPYREAYETLAAETGFGDRIKFTGCQADPRPSLLGSDLFVLASHAEPAALVLAEAREAGCAIVATSVGGNSEMLDGGTAGVLVPPSRPDLLAAAIIEIHSDSTRLAEMRTRSRSNLDQFTVDRTSDECLSVYDSVLN